MVLDRAECMKQRIIPQAHAQKIFHLFDTKFRALAEHLSKKDGWRAEVRSTFIDDFNRIFIIYSGECELKLPKWIDLEDKEFFRIESNGLVSQDFVLKPTDRMSGNKRVYEFQGDMIVKLDEIVLEMAKLCTQVAASYAIDFVVGQLAEFFNNLQFDSIGDAIYNSGKNLTEIAAGKAGTEIVQKYTIYEKQYSVLQTLKISIRNGNFTSFMLFNIVAVGVNQGLKYAGTTLGGLLGTIISPGAGTLIGSLVGRAGTIIIGQFVMKKVGIDWYYKYQFGKLINYASRASESEGWYLRKYKALFEQMLNKLKSEIESNRYDKFGILMNYFKNTRHTNEELRFLADFVSEVNEIMRYRVLQLNDVYASRMFHQLKVSIEKRKFSEEIMKKFGY